MLARSVLVKRPWTQHTPLPMLGIIGIKMLQPALEGVDLGQLLVPP